jgi:hypothetical protein
MVRAGRVLAAGLLVLCATEAYSQQQQESSTMYPRWDAGGSWGLIFTNRRDLQAYDEADPGASALSVDFGRYFTTHLKADVGVMWSTTHYADVRWIPIPDVPQGYEYLQLAQVSIRPTSVSAAVTYQFRENEFMHPYLSGGVRAIRQSIHTERYASTLTIRGVRYTVPAIDEHETSVIARPFVAVGCKSYFNRWVFMRSEWLVALGSRGYSHSTLRIGTGFDF